MGIDRTWLGRGTAAVVALAATGALVGCSAGSTTGGTAQTEPGTTTTKSSPANPGQDKPAEQAGPPEKCADLAVSTEDVRTDGEQKNLPIVFTNNSGEPCTVAGFPGVRLDGVDGIKWDIGRRNEQVGAVTLEPGQRAMAALTFASRPPGDGWEVRTLVVTPPDTTATQELPWPAGPVLLQDGATRPVTHIGRMLAFA